MLNSSEKREERHNKKYIINNPKNTNSFNEDDDTFSNVGLIIKKRIRTASKNKYNEFFVKIAEKTSDKLYDLFIQDKYNMNRNEKEEIKI